MTFVLPLILDTLFNKALPKLFEPLLEPPSTDADDALDDDDEETEADGWVGKMALLQLLNGKGIFLERQRLLSSLSTILHIKGG